MQDKRDDPNYQEEQGNLLSGEWEPANKRKLKKPRGRMPKRKVSESGLWYLHDKALHEARAERGDDE